MPNKIGECSWSITVHHAYVLMYFDVIFDVKVRYKALADPCFVTLFTLSNNSRVSVPTHNINNGYDFTAFRRNIVTDFNCHIFNAFQHLQNPSTAWVSVAQETDLLAALETAIATRFDRTMPSLPNTRTRSGGTERSTGCREDKRESPNFCLHLSWVGIHQIVLQGVPKVLRHLANKS
jgi:hypothetical protein